MLPRAFGANVARRARPSHGSYDSTHRVYAPSGETTTGAPRPATSPAAAFVPLSTGIDPHHPRDRLDDELAARLERERPPRRRAPALDLRDRADRAKDGGRREHRRKLRDPRLRVGRPLRRVRRRRELRAIERRDRPERVPGHGVRAHLGEPRLFEPLAHTALERAPPFEADDARRPPFGAERAIQRADLLDVPRDGRRVLRFRRSHLSHRSEPAERRIRLVAIATHPRRAIEPPHRHADARPRLERRRPPFERDPRRHRRRGPSPSRSLPSRSSDSAGAFGRIEERGVKVRPRLDRAVTTSAATQRGPRGAGAWVAHAPPVSSADRVLAHLREATPGRAVRAEGESNT